jgi:hypothetical protein
VTANYLHKLFAGTTSPSSWMSHAQGVTHLMKLRGPKAHENEWGRTILLSFRPMIVMNSMFSGQDCFLAEPRWQKVTRRDTSSTGSGSPSSPNASDAVYDRHDFVEDYFQLLARLPAVLRSGYMLREANRAGIPVDPTTVSLLSIAAERLRAEFMAWYPSLLPLNPSPIEVPSKHPSPIFETVLKYKSPWMGSLHSTYYITSAAQCIALSTLIEPCQDKTDSSTVSYWASMIILQECLNQCGYATNFAESNVEFAQNIFRSLETVGQGLMGPYRCGYALRIAFEVADEPTQAWLKENVLREFEKAYAATSVSDYEAALP